MYMKPEFIYVKYEGGVVKDVDICCNGSIKIWDNNGKYGVEVKRLLVVFRFTDMDKLETVDDMIVLEGVVDGKKVVVKIVTPGFKLRELLSD